MKGADSFFKLHFSKKNYDFLWNPDGVKLFLYTANKP